MNYETLVIPILVGRMHFAQATVYVLAWLITKVIPMWILNQNVFLIQNARVILLV